MAFSAPDSDIVPDSADFSAPSSDLPGAAQANGLAKNVGDTLLDLATGAKSAYKRVLDPALAGIGAVAEYASPRFTGSLGERYQRELDALKQEEQRAFQRSPVVSQAARTAAQLPVYAATSELGPAGTAIAGGTTEYLGGGTPEEAFKSALMGGALHGAGRAAGSALSKLAATPEAQAALDAAKKQALAHGPEMVGGALGMSHGFPGAAIGYGAGRLAGAGLKAGAEELLARPGVQAGLAGAKQALGTDLSALGRLGKPLAGPAIVAGGKAAGDWVTRLLDAFRSPDGQRMTPAQEYQRSQSDPAYRAQKTQFGDTEETP